MIAAYLAHRIERGEIALIDAHFSELMMRLGRTSDRRLGDLFADLSQALSNQHSCLDLSNRDDALTLLEKLTALPIVSDGTTLSPLVINGSLLYMQRYHEFECDVASWLKERAIIQTTTDPTAIDAALDRFLPSADRQRDAVRLAVTAGLAVITGGPGTGKTTTVVNLLGVICALADGTRPVIKIAAPTGKAAMRLGESIDTSSFDADITIQTLHRLLGVRAGGRQFRHGPDNPLIADFLVIDEVSMIDLAMMHRVLAALSPHTHLVLIGDPNQLPSVDAGNILADICAEVGTQSAMASSIVTLDTNYRFDTRRGIGRWATAIREGRMPDKGTALEQTEDEVRLMPIDALSREPLLEIYGHYRQSLSAENPEALLDAFDRARILCPMRDGEYGVIAVNAAIELALMEQGEISRDDPYYHGRPVLITRNDYNLKLFNGDIGICIRDQKTTEPTVIFRDATGMAQTYLATRLPPHETCFAMTVHKAQGSEFDHVVMVLPAATPTASELLLNRELLYTAVTRAKRSVSLYVDTDALAQCLKNRTVRSSGLAARLHHANEIRPPPRPAGDQHHPS